MIKSCNSTLEKSDLISLVKWTMSTLRIAGGGDTWELFFLFWVAPVHETERCCGGLLMALWVCSLSLSWQLSYEQCVYEAMVSQCLF